MITLNAMSKDYPFRLFLKLVVVVSLGAVLVGVLLYISSEYFVGGSYIESIQQLSIAKTEIIKKSFMIYAFTGILIIVGLGVITLFYSHRIAGPLFRLGKESRQIAMGDLTVHVKLRQKDAIHPLADSLNEVVEAYKKRIIVLRERVEAVKKAALALQDINHEDGNIENKIDLLKKDLEDLENSLKELRL